MKKNIIINTGLSRKGAQYANRRMRQLATCILWLIAICFALYAFAEPASAASAGGMGLSLATLSAIPTLDDVSDRETHGNEMAYQVVLICTSQLADKFDFPQPDADRQVALSKSILAAGESAHMFEAHTIPTLVSSAEKGDITTTGTNTFTMIMGGDRTALKNFLEDYSGGKFIILFKHIKDTVWHIIGEAERPMILGNTETKNDADGRYSTLTFTRNSVYQDYLVKFAASETIQDLLSGNSTQQGG